HTRSKRDWSSDVCSSDLVEVEPRARRDVRALRCVGARGIGRPELLGSRRPRTDCRSRREYSHQPRAADERTPPCRSYGPHNPSLLQEQFDGGGEAPVTRSKMTGFRPPLTATRETMVRLA